MEQNSLNLIGRGLSYPINSSETKGVTYSEDIERINQSLYIIFTTPIGTRLMMPSFGSDINKFRFDPLDTVLMENLRYSITESIRRWEPRVTVTAIEFLTDKSLIDQSILYISITYHIIDANVEGNFVFPYKLSTYDTIEAGYK